MINNPQGLTCRVCGAVLVQHDPQSPLFCPKAPEGHNTPGAKGTFERSKQMPEAFRHSGKVKSHLIFTRVSAL